MNGSKERHGRSWLQERRQPAQGRDGGCDLVDRSRGLVQVCLGCFACCGKRFRGLLVFRQRVVDDLVYENLQLTRRLRLLP